MRVLVRCSIPPVAGSRAIADGRLGPVLGRLVEALAPEAVYFLMMDGRLTGLLFCELTEASRIPAIAELLVMGFEADVDLLPTMTTPELLTGLAEVTRLPRP